MNMHQDLATIDPDEFGHAASALSQSDLITAIGQFTLQLMQASEEDKKDIADRLVALRFLYIIQMDNQLKAMGL